MYAFSPYTEDGLPTPNITCLDESTLQVRGKVTDPGMTYEILGHIQATSSSSSVVLKRSSTSTTNGTANTTVSIIGAQEAWITWVSDTDYSLDAGDVGHGFSFQEADPHAKLVSINSTASPSDSLPTRYFFHSM